MDENLSAEEPGWLKRLDTDDPVKPAPPAQLAARLIALGLVIDLTEAGLQLNDLGRARLPHQ